MRRRTPLLVIALAATFAVSLFARASATAADEISRLAAMMEWKPGFVVADIGAGDGRYAFAAAEYVPSGKVFATEIDAQKLDALRGEVKRKNLLNVQIVESKEADTNLPPECCDAIFLRRVYHHLTKPGEFDAALARSLKPHGLLAIIDFPPRRGLEPVQGVPANRGGHGIPEHVVVEELTAAGLAVLNTADDWPENSYCVVFIKK